MKNLNFIAKAAVVGYMLVAVLFSGCGNGEKSINGVKYETEIIDSCEYIVRYNGYQKGYLFSHKGNCKFCAQRSKK